MIVHWKSKVSSMIIFKLFRRHANNRVHQKEDKQVAGNESDGTNSTGESSNNSAGDRSPHQVQNLVSNSQFRLQPAAGAAAAQQLPANTLSTLTTGSDLINSVVGNSQQQFGLPAAPAKSNDYYNNNNSFIESDGVYRVPETSTFGGRRFIIGPRSAITGVVASGAFHTSGQQFYNATTNAHLIDKAGERRHLNSLQI